jgi:hypothetical protein
MPTTGTVLAILYIRYHVLDDRSAYVRRAYNRLVYNPPIYSPSGQKQGGCKGGNGARNGQAQARKPLQTLGKWRAATVTGCATCDGCDTCMQATR